MNFLEECWRLWSSKYPEITKMKYSNSGTRKISLHLRAGKQHWRQVKTLLWEDDLFLEEESARLLKWRGIPMVSEAEFHPGRCSQRDILLPQMLSRTAAPKSWLHFNNQCGWQLASVTPLCCRLWKMEQLCANIPLHPGSTLFSPACWPENNSSNCCQIKQTR